MVPGQETNGDNLGKSLFEILYNNGMMYVLIGIASTVKFIK